MPRHSNTHERRGPGNRRSTALVLPRCWCWLHLLRPVAVSAKP